ILSSFKVQRRGTVTATNSSLQVDGLTGIGAPGFPGATGSGILTLNSSSIAQLTDINVGDATNSSGTLNLFGGTLTVLGTLTLAAQPGSSTGTVAITSGQLVQTNSTILVGSYGVGTFSQSGGTSTAQSIQLGNGAGSKGTLTLSGGTMTLSDHLVVGN